MIARSYLAMAMLFHTGHGTIWIVLWLAVTGHILTALHDQSIEKRQRPAPDDSGQSISRNCFSDPTSTAIKRLTHAVSTLKHFPGSRAEFTLAALHHPGRVGREAR